MKQVYEGKVMIECPNTIFHLYINTIEELSKIEIFMKNIRRAKDVSLNDIYTWCNRHGIVYNTSFNFHKDFTIGKTLRSYWNYTKSKFKYQFKILPV